MPGSNQPTNLNDQQPEQDTPAAIVQNISALLSAAGIQSGAIPTPEQGAFVMSILSAQAGVSPLLALRNFPTTVRERLGTDVANSLNDCVDRILDDSAGEAEWERARVEGRALLRGEQDLEALYDKVFSDPVAVELARSLRSEAKRSTASATS